MIIPLGCCCEITFVVKRLFPETMRSPFCWMSIHYPSEIAKVLKNNFIDYEDIEDIDKTVNYNIHNPHNNRKEDLLRRIKRFNDAINSDEYILFVVKCHTNKSTFPYAKCMSIDEAKILLDVIKSLRTDNFHLLIVNESDKEEQKIIIDNLIIDWIVGKIKGDECLVVNCHYEVNTYFDKRWMEIFNQFPLIKKEFLF